MARSEAPDISLPEALAVDFVEIGPEIIESAAPPAETPPEEPEVEPEPEPEPELEPEPEPEPEPELEPEPEPEVIPEPPKPKPPPPKPKPKPKPKPEPPKPKPPEPPPPPSGTGAQSNEPPKGPPAGQPTGEPRLIGSVDYAGRKPNPEYPRASLMRREQGRVVVRVLIGAKGNVERATVQVSSGHERLDKAAVEAARKARFKPYTVNGVAQPALADIPFDFSVRR